MPLEFLMSPVKMSRALDSSGCIVNVSEVQRGKACNCFCIGCGNPLIAKQGKHRRDHFSHNHSSEDELECTWGPETEIHIIAKEIIYEDKCLCIPIGTIECDNERVKFDEVFLEVKDGNRIPDVIATINGERIYIEIAVTHFCDKQKIIEFKYKNINCLEIDLSNFKVRSEYIDKDDLRRTLNEANSTWLSVSPVGDIAGKIHNHNRNKLSELHRNHNKDKYRLENEIMTLQTKITDLTRNKLLAERSCQDVIARLQSIQSQLEVGEKALRLNQEKLNLSNNDLRRIKSLDTEIEKNALEYQQMVAENQSLRIALDKEKDEFVRYWNILEQRENAILDKEKDIIKQQDICDNIKQSMQFTIEQKACKLAEDKFKKLLSDKCKQVSCYEDKISKAEKEYEEVKRKYASFIKF